MIPRLATTSQKQKKKNGMNFSFGAINDDVHRIRHFEEANQPLCVRHQTKLITRTALQENYE